MGPAIALVGLVAMSLLILGATMRRTGRTSRTQTPPFRSAVPWIAGAMLIVGGILVAVPGIPAGVVAGLVIYAGVAVTAMWRLVTLDRASRWMTPSRRLARFGFSAVALTWLGLVLGFLLDVADLITNAPS